MKQLLKLYKYNPRLLPQFSSYIFPFLVLYFKINLACTGNSKNNFFKKIIKKDKDLKKILFYLLFYFFSFHRILFIFQLSFFIFKKPKYKWLSTIKSLLSTNWYKTLTTILLFLKLDFSKYLFNSNFFCKSVFGKIIVYEQFKWRMTLNHFFIFGRYIEYIRRIQYNEYLTISENPVLFKSSRISQYWTTRKPHSLLFEYKVNLIDFLDHYYIYKLCLEPTMKYKDSFDLISTRISDFSFFFFINSLINLKQSFSFLFFSLSFYYKSYLFRAIYICVNLWKNWLFEWVRYRYRNIKYLFQSLRLFHRKVVSWLKHYCIATIVNENKRLIHTNFFIITESLSNNIVSKFDLVMVELITFLLVEWSHWLELKRLTRCITREWLIIFYLVTNWYHVILVDLVNFYDSTSLTYILKLMKFNIEYIWWRVFYAGSAWKASVFSDYDVYMKYSIIDLSVMKTRSYQLDYLWFFFKKTYLSRIESYQFLSHEAIVDIVIQFFAYKNFYEIFYDKYRFNNILSRSLKWIKMFEFLRNFFKTNLNTIHYYIDPFDRMLEWDIFFRDTGPYLDQDYLNAYRYKLKTVCDELQLENIDFVVIQDWLNPETIILEDETIIEKNKL